MNLGVGISSPIYSLVLKPKVSAAKIGRLKKFLERKSQ